MYVSVQICLHSVLIFFFQGIQMRWIKAEMLNQIENPIWNYLSSIGFRIARNHLRVLQYFKQILEHHNDSWDVVIETVVSGKEIVEHSWMICSTK